MEYTPTEYEAGYKELQERIKPVFTNTAGHETASKYLEGLLGEAQRKNGWQLAESLGQQTPYAIQNMLYRGRFSADGLRDKLRTYVSEKLGTPDGVLVVDETGFLKQGKKSCGVKRQYSGTAGRIQNCQVGVFLTYSGDYGQAILDRQLYIPEEWCSDQERRKGAGIPPETVFHTKPEMALEMIQRATQAGVEYKWVTGDCVYGDYRSIRLWLEQESKCYVMNVSSKEYVWEGAAQVRISTILEQLTQEGWFEASCGEGSKGARVYEWKAMQIGPSAKPGWSHTLLIRRGENEKGGQELKAYACYAPNDTPVDKLVEIAGRRWTVERCFADGKSQVGLDHYEVRSYEGWYKHITFSCLALALLAVLSGYSRDRKRMQEHEPGTSSLEDFKKKRGLHG